MTFNQNQISDCWESEILDSKIFNSGSKGHLFRGMNAHTHWKMIKEKCIRTSKIIWIVYSTIHFAAYVCV